MQYTGKITENRDGWNAPGGQKITIIKPGTYLFSESVNGWVGLTANGKFCWTHRDYVSDWEPRATPPPTPEPTTEYIIHVKDGISRKFIPE